MNRPTPITVLVVHSNGLIGAMGRLVIASGCGVPLVFGSACVQLRVWVCVSVCGGWGCCACLCGVSLDEGHDALALAPPFSW